MANVHAIFVAWIALLGLALVLPVNAAADESTADVPVVLVAPLRAGVADRPALVGEVVAETSATAGFQVGGRISERLVRRGQRVEAGEPLARLDARDLRARVDSARSERDQARAEATLARQELDRTRDLFERTVASRQALDQAVSRQQAAESQVASAEARLSEARNALDYAELPAPFTGVMVELLADVGDVVAAGQPVLRLAADEGRLVEVAVPERRLSGLPDTAVAWLEADAVEMEARIDSVAGAADPASRTFAARYRLEPAADRDRPWEIGQTARLEFAGERSVRQVPVGALFARDRNPQVYRVEGDRVHAVEVIVRAIEESYAVIETELPEGTPVVAVGVNRLHDGQSVRPRNAGELAAGAADGERP
ncbi:efflux RND transporter periplasmic adaptor subunit [Guyparkeria sp.]|uniref:efflux RND transporter periplasmic adaptor subunit n=1 Tax=Guyparkeria sp. TaxID=2035736 RepID=UPI003561FE7E